jgi:hypothetical protein
MCVKYQQLENLGFSSNGVTHFLDNLIVMDDHDLALKQPEQPW